MTEATHDDWIAQVERLLELTQGASGFVQRAGEQFPDALPYHAVAVARLWQQADALDEQVCSLLDEINRRLLQGQGELSLTRGASVRTLVVGEALLFYDCLWTLLWEEERRGIAVKLSVEPQMESYHARVESLTTDKAEDIRYPLQEEQLKEALAKAYVAEMTV